MKKKIIISLLLALGIIAIAGTFYFQQTRSRSPMQKPKAQVETQVITSRNLSEIRSGYGNVQSQYSVVLKSQQTNRITQIAFTGGEHVKQGQLLLQLDNRSAKAQVAEDQAKLVQAKAQWQRQDNMLKRGLVSQTDYDSSLSLYQQAQAVLEQDQSVLEQLSLKAPFDGTISITDYHVGDLLNTGDPIAALYDPQKLTVTYQMPQSKRGELKIGQSVTIRSLLNPTIHSSGKVIYISPEVNNGVLTLKAVINNTDLLQPGQNVKVSQKIAQLDNQLTIPTSSLLVSLDSMQAYIVKNGKAVLRELEVGHYYDGYVQIKSGLKEGEQVVVNGQHFLRSGEPVIVVNGDLNMKATASAKNLEASKS